MCDTSTLIELAKRSLLLDTLKLPFRLAVPDVLFEEKHFDLCGVEWPQLERLGLQAHALDATGVARAVACQATWPMLSIYDCFAVALAAARGWPLLTHYGCLAAAAMERKLAVWDWTWLFDRLVERGVVEAPARHDRLESRCPRLWQPTDRHPHEDNRNKPECEFRAPTCPTRVRAQG